MKRDLETLVLLVERGVPTRDSHSYMKRAQPLPVELVVKVRLENRPIRPRSL